MKKLPTRKLLRALAIGAAGLLFSLAALSLPWHGDRLAEPPRLLSSARGSGPLRAGAAAVRIDLPPGAPVGGFARGAFRAEGIRDPVGARALYLEVPGARVAIVSVEVVFVTEPLVRHIEELAADLGLDALLVGATHTHAGPGGYWDFVAAERAALGGYDPAVFEAIARGAAAAVHRASAEAAPATLAVARGTAEGLVRDRSGGGKDGRLLSLRITAPRGEPIAELLVFPAHATTLGKQNHRISGDWPGRFLDAPGRGVRLFFQGAVGDQSAQVPPGDDATRPERYAGAVLGADDALAPSTPSPETSLATATVAVRLPPPDPGALPAVLRRAAATLTWSRLPEAARVTALRLGPALLVAVPGEPTRSVGARWRAVAGDGAEVVSLVDGYVGYVEEPDRVRRGEGEARRTWFGAELADRLEQGVASAARAAAP